MTCCSVVRATGAIEITTRVASTCTWNGIIEVIATDFSACVMNTKCLEVRATGAIAIDVAITSMEIVVGTTTEFSACVSLISETRFEVRATVVI